MGQCYSVAIEGKIKDDALLVKLTNDYINQPGSNFSDDCWDKSDLTTAEGCIRAILAGDTQPEGYVIQELKNGNKMYSNGFDACYSWENVLYRWFIAVASSFEDGTEIEVYPDDGRWIVRVENGVGNEIK